ncbi:3-methyladenine DNA glycosylase [Thermoplasmatales archaeon SW_10_69_26]|nr:MAG: 3-methyladenine DNA glycosylase [Thermoplasmatales archaeon SW_10_69_26]
MDRGFFARPTPEVARALLGHEIVREDPDPARLRIVETEAYLGPEDPGSHATRGPETQAGRLWEEPGQAYVYVCYGIHQMLNVVAHEPDRIGAVLVRAAEPVDGLGRMQERRGREAPTEIASGPGRLAEALGVTRSEHDGVDLTRGSLRFEAGEEVAAEQVAVTGRIGLSEGGDHLLRFLDRDSSHVSRSLADDPDHGLADVELRKR